MYIIISFVKVQIRLKKFGQKKVSYGVVHGSKYSLWEKIREVVLQG